MKKLCLSGLAPRFGTIALLVGASGVGATSGCSAQPPSIGVGGEASMTSSGTGGASTATTATSASASSGGGQGGGTSSTGGMGGAGGATSSSSGTGGDVGQGGAPFIPPTGTAEYPAETEQNGLKSNANLVKTGTKGFTASLWPVGDVDVFKVDVTVNGSQLQASTGDGQGSCPADAKTYLRAFDPSGSLLAADKASGPGTCSLLASTIPSLQGLAVGTYYLQVENLTIDPLPFYVLDVKVAPPSCGDGLLQLAGGEQCDDGANVAGDGCSAACKLEGIYGAETEANDTLATANSLASLDGIVASIGVVSDQDYFSFAVTVPGSSVTLTVDDGLGKCPGAFDSKMYLYDAGGVELTNDNDSGPDSCSAITPKMYPAAASLAVGTYHVKVEEFGNDAPAPFYVLGVKVRPPACGDGILQVGEQCDDSNTVAGDGCSATCALEGNFLPETEPNDTQVAANPLGAADGLIGSINPIGDQDYYSFDVVTPGSSVFVEVTNGFNGCPSGFDSKLTLFNPSNALISTVDDGGIAKCSLLSPATTATAANMAPGTYRIRVEYSGNTTAVASYVVKIKVVPPSCGDGVVQPVSEQCDDSNSAAGDGCSATCQAEAPYEIEPNGTRATATPTWPGVSNWIGAIYPAGDHDYYSFTLAVAGTVTLTTHAVNNTASCPGDTLLHLDDSAGMSLMTNDDAAAGTGVAPCSSLTKALPAGTYYAWVQRYLDMVTIPPYQLDLTVQ